MIQAKTYITLYDEYIWIVKWHKNDISSDSYTTSLGMQLHVALSTLRIYTIKNDLCWQV